MRTLALVTATLMLVSTLAVAQKPSSHVRQHPASDTRQGGETIADAVEVPFPFTDTGATCDNIDDYDEVCPYTGSTAPDVVYTFVPPYDTAASVDMLGSTYDTKIYLYNEDLALVACNDDFYPDYVSCIQDFYFEGGQRYHLVIDGYGGDCGEYVVTICEHLPCVTECSNIDVLENEPPLVEGYVDTFNGGCDVAEPVFQLLELPPGDEVLLFCGTSGYVGEGDQILHDTDWLQLVALGDEVSIDFESPYGFPMRLDVLFLDDCENVSLLPYELGTCDFIGDITVPTTPGQLVTLRVAPLYDTRPGCSWADIDQYRLTISGLEPSVRIESRSWTGIKALYE